jgi:phytoene desaturase
MLPAFYSLLNHVVSTQGVFYSRGGIYKIVEALVAMGKKHGVTYHTRSEVEHIGVAHSKVTGVVVNGEELHADSIISNADPHYTETKLLDANHRDHTDHYWQSRTSSPSALLMYLGVNKRYSSLQHHNLLFSRDWQQNFAEIFGKPQFPTDPSLYVCVSSKTDSTVAPVGSENMFILVPLAAGLNYTQTALESYADKILRIIEGHMHAPDLREHIVYKKLFCVRDFSEHLHSFRGSGLGLSHTLLQTASFRPHSKSRKVANLYHVGANVHPGIGMPSTLISAELVVSHITK